MLGTGNFLAPGRYWNSFVLDRHVLVEPAPTALPHLRKVGVSAPEIDLVAISHFHADHTFGWPFLLLELARQARTMPVHVVGPPGVQRFLTSMLDLGGVPGIGALARDVLDLHFVELDGSWQHAGGVRLRGVEVEHVPELECFGFLFELDGGVVGYSGDTRPCPGLDELASHADVLILECNGPHDPVLPVTHMDQAGVEALRRRHPDLPLVLTHLGAEPDLTNLPGTIVPSDLDVLTLPRRHR
jgi:ribonuclease Z